MKKKKQKKIVKNTYAKILSDKKFAQKIIKVKKIYSRKKKLKKDDIL